LIRRLRERRSDIRVLVTGVPGEADRITRVAHAAGAKASTQSLRQAIALVAASDVVFTPDTGIIHIAAAFGRPTISLHRPNKWMWSAYRVPSRTLFSDSNDSLQSIGVADVAAAAEALLEEQYGTVRA
jgi:ADP-heptose:LPS heptosyltransferase